MGKAAYAAYKADKDKKDEAAVEKMMGGIYAQEDATRSASSRHTPAGKERQWNREPTEEASKAHAATEEASKLDKGGHAARAMEHSQKAMAAHREDDPQSAATSHFRARDAHEEAAKEHGGWFGNRKKAQAHRIAAAEHRKAGREARVEGNDRVIGRSPPARPR